MLGPKCGCEREGGWEAIWPSKSHGSEGSESERNGPLGYDSQVGVMVRVVL